MEDHKLRYLQQFLERRNGTSVENYTVAMRDSEKEARNFYADPIRLDLNEFVEMMLLDSCFIIQLFHKFVNMELRKDDPIFQLAHIKSSIRGDLMLFENQLPFFVLMKLFNMPQNFAASLNNFVHMSRAFFKAAKLCVLSVPPVGDLEKLDIKHLLGLLHYCCCYKFHSMVSQNVPIKEKFLKSATELREAGIKFKKDEEGKVDDNTESFLRNLIAYENYLPAHDTSRNYFTAYMNFMDFLVNSSEDVEILSHHGIIHNLLGDNAVVSTMLSKLGNNIVIPFFGYPEVYNNVNKHCKESWN
ncbi:hypothetical protein HYC85_029403 [Camellia sinensis]|uniref:Uncharacterized protein n=1 Tax=Camellia sinensis TaxID=4442 RepID=A0A7J7FXY5_CAMSI|nr:hypothetical protein HYC85_029403 [Camellia sinensis]